MFAKLLSTHRSYTPVWWCVEDLTESEKLFQFCTDPNQIWHARHLGPWATAQQIWEESDDFEFLASRELGQGAGEFEAIF